MTPLEEFLAAARDATSKEKKRMDPYQSEVGGRVNIDPFMLQHGKLGVDLLDRSFRYSPDKNVSMYVNPFTREFGDPESEDYYVQNRKAGIKYKNKKLSAEADTDGNASLKYGNFGVKYDKANGLSGQLELIKNVMAQADPYGGFSLGYGRQFDNHGYNVTVNPKNKAINVSWEGQF
jgi:hypothetical protein